MDPDKTVTDWIVELRGGDPEAARHLWDRFFLRLKSLARERLAPGIARVRDEEDVALSAMNALWELAKDGRLDGVGSRDDLWQLLALITCRKAIDTARAATRSPVVGESGLGVSEGLRGSIDRIAAGEPGPAFLEHLDLTCRELMGRLDPWLQRIVLLRLHGHTNEEIAEKENRSVKTIERYMRMVRQQWSAP